MAMFDNPKNELNRLQEELLAEENTKWEDELGDLDALLADYTEDRTLPVKEAYKQVKNVHQISDTLLEEDDDDDEDDEKPAKPVKEKKSSEKGVVGLIIAACLETVAIIGLLAWWFFCLR